jgi:hypothetical protein
MRTLPEMKRKSEIVELRVLKSERIVVVWDLRIDERNERRKRRISRKRCVG